MNTPALTPAQKIIQRAQLQARLSSPAPDATASTNELRDSPSSSTPDPFRTLFSSIPNNGAGRSLSSYAQQLKEQYDLDPNASAEVDKYCGLTLEERLLLGFIVNLKHTQILKKTMNKSEDYRIPGALLTSLRSHAFMLLLSPRLVAYRGNIAKATVDAMRELGVSDIPAPHELGKLKIVQKGINDYLTDCRYQIKDKIAGDLKKKRKNRSNVATLTSKIIGEKSVTITLALYRRVSFLKTLKGDNFWVKADKVVGEWREAAGKDASKLLGFFEFTYKEDCNNYGDPSQSGVIATPSAEIPAHQKVIDEHAAKVKPPAPKASSKKRARIEVDDSDEEEEDLSPEDRQPSIPPSPSATSSGATNMATNIDCGTPH
ncbi:hypothetical protein K435DRAFT_868668 [Dendrothele bispora CBS 962.96]|uniref:Uncharacterized protein n=1 Tax=Dendrothele bispora (strain CBS 962.96) TaxID=1314807 RepID=A0A4S8LCK6_DENBC|nr:hypothetical protein K435DRAFT_868668 [Dendrothele bispora CBS 962.96]